MDVDYSIQYDKWHDSSDAHYAETARFYARLMAPILPTIDKTARILDVGCGTGLLVYALREMGYLNVRGVDLSEQQIARALARDLPCHRLGPDELATMAIEEAGSVDVIFLMDVLEHVPVLNQITFLDQIGRLLADSGRLILSVPNASASFAARQLYIDWTHVCAFTEHSLEFVVRNAGFAAPDFHPYEFGEIPCFPYLNHPAFWTGLLRRAFRTVRRLQAIAELGRQGARIPLSLNLLAVCRRV
jgi:2-polyprenyl-3-methyl-5-hydroxy-6-metoxy-1,4-benzoquinol methylase